MSSLFPAAPHGWSNSQSDQLIRSLSLVKTKIGIASQALEVVAPALGREVDDVEQQWARLEKMYKVVFSARMRFGYKWSSDFGGGGVDQDDWLDWVATLSDDEEREELAPTLRCLSWPLTSAMDSLHSISSSSSSFPPSSSNSTAAPPILFEPQFRSVHGPSSESDLPTLYDYVEYECVDPTTGKLYRDFYPIKVRASPEPMEQRYWARKAAAEGNVGGNQEMVLVGGSNEMAVVGGSKGKGKRKMEEVEEPEEVVEAAAEAEVAEEAELQEQAEAEEDMKEDKEPVKKKAKVVVPLAGGKSKASSPASTSTATPTPKKAPLESNAVLLSRALSSLSLSADSDGANEQDKQKKELVEAVFARLEQEERKELQKNMEGGASQDVARFRVWLTSIFTPSTTSLSAPIPNLTSELLFTCFRSTFPVPSSGVDGSITLEFAMGTLLGLCIPGATVDEDGQVKGVELWELGRVKPVKEKKTPKKKVVKKEQKEEDGGKMDVVDEPEEEEDEPEKGEREVTAGPSSGKSAVLKPKVKLAPTTLVPPQTPTPSTSTVHHPQSQPAAAAESPVLPFAPSSAPSAVAVPLAGSSSSTNTIQSTAAAATGGGPRRGFVVPTVNRANNSNNGNGSTSTSGPTSTKQTPKTSIGGTAAVNFPQTPGPAPVPSTSNSNGGGFVSGAAIFSSASAFPFTPVAPSSSPPFQEDSEMGKEKEM